MRRRIQLVFTNAKPGTEDQFNEWYDNVHIPESLQLPGYAGAQRFELIPDVKWGENAPFRYLTIYEVDDLDALEESITAEIANRADAVRTGASLGMTPTDTMEDERVHYYYQAIGDPAQDSADQ